MASDLDAQIWAVLGASGVGKGLLIKGFLRKKTPARLVVWDFMDEYGEFADKVTTLGQIRALMLKHRRGPLRVRYVPRGAGEKALRKEFEALCELVYAWGRCVFVPEELANVTTPGWSPAAWRKMTTSGRHQGVHIIGTTQTPALVDKTFLGNCSVVFVFALREQPHRQYVARAIDAPLDMVTGLAKFHYVQRDHNAGTLRQGVVSIPGAVGSAATGSGTDAGKRRQAAAPESPMTGTRKRVTTRPTSEQRQ